MSGRAEGRGRWQIGAPRGVALRLHWSAALPLLVGAGLFRSPAGALGMLIVILVHALGHVMGALPAGPGRLRSLTLDWTGAWVERRGAWRLGALRWVAWGGALAQAALLLAAWAARPWVALLPPGSSAHALHGALLLGNLWLLMLNLLPLGRLDGAAGWSALRMAPRAPRAARSAPPPAGPPAVTPEVAAVAEALMDDLVTEHRRRRRAAAD